MSVGHCPDEIGVGLWEPFLLIITEQNEPDFSAAALQAGVNSNAMRQLVDLIVDGF
jgi:hypothetical protein